MNMTRKLLALLLCLCALLSLSSVQYMRIQTSFVPSGTASSAFCGAGDGVGSSAGSPGPAASKSSPAKPAGPVPWGRRSFPCRSEWERCLFILLS